MKDNKRSWHIIIRTSDGTVTVHNSYDTYLNALDTVKYLQKHATYLKMGTTIDIAQTHSRFSISMELNKDFESRGPDGFTYEERMALQEFYERGEIREEDPPF